MVAYLGKGSLSRARCRRSGWGTPTAWPYVNETVLLLAAGTPKLRQALREAKDAGHA